MPSVWFSTRLQSVVLDYSAKLRIFPYRKIGTPVRTVFQPTDTHTVQFIVYILHITVLTEKYESVIRRIGTVRRTFEQGTRNKEQRTLKKETSSGPGDQYARLIGLDLFFGGLTPCGIMTRHFGLVKILMDVRSDPKVPPSVVSRLKHQELSSVRSTLLTISTQHS